MKIIKRLFSALLVISIMLTMLAVIPASATTVYDYSPIDISAAANGKFYIDLSTEGSNVPWDGNAQRNFLVGTGGNYHFYAVNWPITLRTRESDSAFPAQAATLTGSTLTSSNTGAIYKMPDKKAGYDAKEVIIIDHNRRYNYGWSGTEAPRTVALTGSYDKLNMLVATTYDFTSRNAELQATVTYADGTVKDVMGTATTDAEGTTTYTYEAIPGATAAQQAANDNFVADLTSVNADVLLPVLQSDGETYKDTYTTHNYATYTDSGFSSVALYEYSFDIDVNKTLSSITFNEKWKGLGGVAIVAISGGTARTATAYERVFNSVELGTAANSKFYIDPTDATEATGTTYHKKNFLGVDLYSPNSYAAAKWPLTVRTREDETTYPAQSGYSIADANAAPIIVSQNTGIEYQLPAKEEGSSATEIILLDEKRYNSWSYSGKSVADVAVSGNYDAVHFLVATARVNPDMQLYVSATYSDGTTEDLLGTVTTVDTTTTYNRALIPGSSAAEQTANTNFVADLDVLVHYSASNTNSSEQFAFETPRAAQYTAGKDATIALYEYSADLDSDKTLTKLTFNEDRRRKKDDGTAYSTNYLLGLGIVAITTEKVEKPNTDCLISDSTAEIANGVCTVSTASPFNGTLLAAVYDKTSGALLATDYEVLAGDTHGATFELSSDEIVAGSNYDVKIYLWDGLSTLKPISEILNVTAQ